jgi:GDP/UDP-N,N'-diacetylbacillosamine 2-epimerase (hydrolysing)
VNIGDRQKGRMQSDNIINVPFRGNEIINAVEKCIENGIYNGINNYYNPNSASLIIHYIKKFNEVI